MENPRNFVMYDTVMNDIKQPDNFMSMLSKETIPGAAFDSSERDPPPRCHPGTRLAIINRTQCFITNRNGNKRMRWIVGPAGVGKSAIMQTLAEAKRPATDNVILGASIFFSIYGRNDGTKAMTTFAYQLAVNHDSYRQFIEEEITRDPSLLGKSMAAQFDKFIIEPFTQRSPNPCRSRSLIIIDGLDECDGHHVQRELLNLISDFCITYPNAPLVWVVASRPEPHITSFLSRDEVTPAYEKEEITVDSNEAREDVERFLRARLTEVQKESLTLKDLPRWPTDHDFLKIASASGGLFAYAFAVTKFIEDPTYGDPVSQLHEVLEVINSIPKQLTEGKSHPMAYLDALYTRIMSKVPRDVMANTRKILLVMETPGDKFFFMELWNWLGMKEHVAYGATHHLRSVLYVPEPSKATESKLRSFHKSFPDFLKDFDRSGFCPEVSSAIWQLNSLCTYRILEEALKDTSKSPLLSAKTPLSWPFSNANIRSTLCQHAAKQNVITFVNRQRELHALRGLFSWHGLIAFDRSRDREMIDSFREAIFGETYRSKLIGHHILKKIQLGTLQVLNIDTSQLVHYRFKCSAATMAKIPSPWSPSCNLGWCRSRYKKGQDQDWTSAVDLGGAFRADLHCDCCTKRFFRHFEESKMQSPFESVTAFITLSSWGWVEYQYIDRENGEPQWTYIFAYNFPPTIVNFYT